MGKNLVIVESPAKARTINKYLGKGFEVMASYGHVRDLVPKEGAVDPERDFEMRYQVIDKNTKHIDAITKAIKKADALYLATDPDREGEAISWHLCELLRERDALDSKPVHRIVFHEITQQAINEAMAEPRELSHELVNAQQARRALDYLVGFNLSPLLWKKVRPGLSAGRVQSPALRLIVEREEEIERFESREYWTIEAEAAKDDQPFAAKLTHLDGKKLTQFSITDKDTADDAVGKVREAAAAVAPASKAAIGTLTVSKAEKKRRKRNPAPPFITSTLQQEASRKLGFGAQRTMRVAQQLYEGVDIDGESVGLITYMRTDSVTLANDAVQAIRDVIQHRYGANAVPKQPRRYKTKSKNAQEAHEAIRPTLPDWTPEDLKPHLSQDQRKLYELIWKRTIACQMTHATLETMTVDLEAGDGHRLRATGSVIVDPGFIAVYQEGKDEPSADQDEGILPAMKEGETVELRAIRGEQHFTEPPPRYTEASLVKALEEYDIGRPSTYAAIVSTLVQREYVVLEKRRFYPTDVGRIVNRFLTQHFPQYVDYEFTARLEDQLDEVARGEKSWVPLMREFWEPFKSLVSDKEQSVSRSDVTHEELDENCPKCGNKLSIRLGRRGRFVGCTGYPDCDYTRSLDGDGDDDTGPEVVEGRSCPQCGSDLVVRKGRYGKFIGCSGYPKCRYLEPLEKPADTGVTCPECGQASMLQRKSRRGKVFYSCSRYPDCKYAVWNEPVAGPCPECRWPILTVKTTKRRGTEHVCPQKECGFSRPAETADQPVKRAASGKKTAAS